jgi:5S rRNA maturation endonuclease (ribonuclease M5)
MLNIKEVLINIGYSNITEDAKAFRMKPIYRDSSNHTVLSVKKDTGYFIDFSKNISGSFYDLIKLSLNLTSVDEAKQWVNSKYPLDQSIRTIKKPELKMTKTYPKDLLLKIIKDHSYWIGRGVSRETLELFQGGVVMTGKMANRYIFPIFSYEQELVGFAGRDLINDPQKDSRPKWKLIGDKSEWKYPLQINNKIVRESKEVILVESIGDCLALWEAGIKNTIVTFGLDLSVSVINYLLKIDAHKIYISFNNDADKNNAGNEAAQKAINKLSRYFDPNQLAIALPPQKDFGNMSKEDITEWKKKI